MKFILATLLLISLAANSQTVNDLRPTVTMKEYVDMQAELNKEWMQRLMDAEIANIKDNINKANASMDKRLDGMNEFRETLKDSNNTFVTWTALIALIFGVAGLFFGWSKYNKDKTEPQSSSRSSKNIQSGDTVEVKK